MVHVAGVDAVVMAAAVVDPAVTGIAAEAVAKAAVKVDAEAVVVVVATAAA